MDQEPNTRTWGLFLKDLRAATTEQELESAARKWRGNAFKGRWVWHFTKYGTMLIKGFKEDLKTKENLNGL